MYLECVDIVGFRGINRLSLILDNNTVLIGENAWGKSSLLDALTLLLSPDPTLYHFDTDDFYHPPGDVLAKDHNLEVIFTFCENNIDDWSHYRYRHLTPLWITNNDGLRRIYFRIQGEHADDGTVSTWRTFLNLDAQPLALNNIEQLVHEVLRIHPVLRLRDARFMRRLRSGIFDKQKNPDQQGLNQQVNQLTDELIRNPHKLTNSELRQGLYAIRQLLEYYFTEHNSQILHRGDTDYHMQSERQAWQSLNSINRMIAESGSRGVRLMLLGLFAALLQVKGGVSLDPNARPLLLVEDPETRLHPIMLSVAWELLNQLPLQRITTTNSGELISLIPVERICRLVREATKVASWRIGPQGMSSEDSRRIAFHIRFNRPSSLFARFWLLVEGETEIWLLNELARQCGYHFETEGIKVIEFAQSGLRPLLRFASRMGIQWHTLVDGDDAGKKYANTVRAMIANKSENEHDSLTVLPALDMEHFLYREGFHVVYHRVSGIPVGIKMQPRKVIEKAIHRSSKPDLAIEVATQAAIRGAESIPPLLKKMFARIVWLARCWAD